MSSSSTTPSQSDTRRYKLTGDVHLVLVDRGGYILFGLRQNTGFEDGAYHVPSGHLEAGESVVETLIREAKEELGITVAAEHVEFAHVMHSKHGGGRAAFFFTVQVWDGDPANLEPEKCGELRWFSRRQLPENLVDYCRVALAHIEAGQPFSLYGW